MTLPICIQYKGELSGTFEKRKGALREKFNAIAEILARHTVHLTPDTISVTGQTTDATIDVHDFDGFTQELPAADYEVRHNPLVRVLS